MSYSLSDEEVTLATGYVLGDLSPEENRRFEQRLRQNPALQREVRLLQSSLQLLPHSLTPVAPPAGLEERILAAHRLALPGPAVVANGRRGRSPTWAKILAALALLSTLLLAVDNLRLRQELSLASQSETERVAALLQRPNSRLVALGSETGTEAAGTLLFTPGQWQEVIVSLGNLPPLPPDQVYRMWLSLNNSQIIPCGEFNTNAEGSVFVKLNPVQTPPQGTKATGIFVTIERVDAPLEPTGPRVMSGSI